MSRRFSAASTRRELSPVWLLIFSRLFLPRPVYYSSQRVFLPRTALCCCIAALGFRLFVSFSFSQSICIHSLLFDVRDAASRFRFYFFLSSSSEAQILQTRVCVSRNRRKNEFVAMEINILNTEFPIYLGINISPRESNGGLYFPTKEKNEMVRGSALFLSTIFPRFFVVFGCRAREQRGPHGPHCFFEL